MGSRRRAQPSGDSEGKTATRGDGGAAQGGPSRKRQARRLSVHDTAAGSAGAGSGGHEESGSILAKVTMCLSMLCDPSVLAARKAALEAALTKVAMEFGGKEFRVEWIRVGPSEDTLQRVLPLLLERVEAEGAAQCFQVCKPWRRELEARGFCHTTAQLCSALAEGRDVGRLRQNALRRMNASTCSETQRAVCLDGMAFLQKSLGRKGSLREWLQSASQEPDASFLSRGGASTARCLGLPLVRWVGKPQGRDPFLDTLSGHTLAVTSLAFSRDGTCIVSGSKDKLAKIWNAATGAEVHTLTGHSATVYWVAFSPDGKRVVSASWDGFVKIWDVETGAEVCTMKGHGGCVWTVAFSPDGKRIVSGSSDTLVKIWNAATGAEECTLEGHSDTVYSVMFSADGKLVASSSRDKLVKIWDVGKGAEVFTLTGHSELVFVVAFSPDGTRIASGSVDHLVKIWNAETGAEIWTSECHNCCGRCICTMQEDEDGEEELVSNTQCPVTGHADFVHRVGFSNDGSLVISGSHDNTVRFWDVASGRQVRELAGHRFALVEGPSGWYGPGRREHTHVVTACGDTLLIYECAKGQPHASDGAAAAPVACFKVAQRIHSVGCHGAAICVGCEGGALLVLEAPFLTS